MKRMRSARNHLIISLSDHLIGIRACPRVECTRGRAIRCKSSSDYRFRAFRSYSFCIKHPSNDQSLLALWMHGDAGRVGWSAWRANNRSVVHVKQPSNNQYPVYQKHNVSISHSMLSSIKQHSYPQKGTYRQDRYPAEGSTKRICPDFTASPSRRVATAEFLASTLNRSRMDSLFVMRLVT